MSTLKIRLEKKKLERAAYVLKCVAHPVRISIIDLLQQGERLSVSELQDVLAIEQSLLSHHLTNMRDKGVVDMQREGNSIHIQRHGPTKAWNVFLVGIDSVENIENVKMEIVNNSTRIKINSETSQVAIHLK